MVRITMIVMTMILTKLMTNPSRVRRQQGTKTGCILGFCQQSVNEGVRNLTGKPVRFPNNSAFITEIRRFVPTSSYLALSPRRQLRQAT